MLKFFISQNVTRPKDFNVIYYLGPYFANDYTTNYEDSVVVDPTPDGYYWGVDFVESPTDISSLIMTHSNATLTSTLGIGGDTSSSDGIIIDSNDEYSYTFIVPASLSDFYTSGFNLNTDTEIAMSHGGTDYTYKFNPSYNGRIKTIESSLYFPNFPDGSTSSSGHIDSIQINGIFGSGPVAYSSVYLYPFDDTSKFSDNTVNIYSNRPADTGISKDDTALDITLNIGDYPLVFDTDLTSYQIKQIDAYGNIVSTGDFSSPLPTRVPSTFQSSDKEVQSSRVFIDVSMNIEGPTYLMYFPTYQLSTSSEYTDYDLDIQVYYGQDMLWSLASTHGLYWRPSESTESNGYYMENTLPNISIDYDTYHSLEDTVWTFKLMDGGDVVSTYEFTVSYSSSDSAPDILFE